MWQPLFLSAGEGCVWRLRVLAGVAGAGGAGVAGAGGGEVCARKGYSVRRVGCGAEICARMGYSVHRVGCGAEVCARKGYSVRRVEVCAGETVRRLLLCVENGCLLHIVLLLCAIKWGI